MLKNIKCCLGAVERASIEGDADAEKVLPLTDLVEVEIMHNIPILGYDKCLGILVHSRTLAEYFIIAILGKDFESPTGADYV